MKIFKKQLELGISISGYKIINSDYMFIIEFDRELKTEDGIKFKQLEQPEYNIINGDWIKNEMPKLDKNDTFGIDLFNEVDYVLFTALFNCGARDK